MVRTAAERDLLLPNFLSEELSFSVKALVYCWRAGTRSQTQVVHMAALSRGASHHQTCLCLYSVAIFRMYTAGGIDQVVVQRASNAHSMGRGWLKYLIKNPKTDAPLSLVWRGKHVTHRFKVENQLDKWRKDSTFDVKGFEQGLLVGRLL